jgi:tRNA threonylcarbamoyladenosine biosynthesis protein TsaB
LKSTSDCYILSIEGSQKVCSVAIHNNGDLMASNSIFTEKAASSILTPQIEQILYNCQLKPTDLEAVAVAKGPGSYTGLRIAVSTAKGLCLAIDKPLIAINTLQAMAAQVVSFFPEQYLFCPMLDARRMEIFCAILNKNLEFIEQTQAKVMDEQSFSELLVDKSVVFFGDGAEKCQHLFGDKLNAHFLEKSIFPTAETIGKLAFEKYKMAKFENLITFEPFYLKEFVGTVPKSR